MGIFSKTQWLTLSEGFEWIGSTPAILVFGIATFVEVVAYYVPWIDNLLDSISIPAANVAGYIATAACLGEMDPLIKWSLATIGGSGSAGSIKIGTAGLRLGSSFLTAGLANPIVSTLEWIASIVMTLLAIIAPFLAVGLACITVVFLLRYGIRFIKWRLNAKGLKKQEASE